MSQEVWRKKWGVTGGGEPRREELERPEVYRQAVRLEERFSALTAQTPANAPATPRF